MWIKKFVFWQHRRDNTRIQSQSHLQSCPICGGTRFDYKNILWHELIDSWGLNSDEVKLIDNQQGMLCQKCGSNLRSMTLAGALNEHFAHTGTLVELCSSSKVAKVRLLEINEAGNLTPYLRMFKNHTLVCYPELDMQKMAFPDNTFDIVIHSDTLEHIPDPIRGLEECRRVIRPSGVLMMTIPIVPTRLTRRRLNLPPSYHGATLENKPENLVYTEYGADFYIDMVEAEWHNIAIFTLGTLNSFAVIGTKSP